MKIYLPFTFFLFSLVISAQEKVYVNLNPDEILNRVRTYSTDRNFEEGVVFIDSINPSDSIYLSLLTTKSYFLINQKKYEEALGVTDEGLAFRNADYNHYFYLNKGVCLVNLQRFDEAQKNYDEALQSYPAYARFYYNKGTAYLSANDKQSAVEMFKKAIEIHPLYASAHYQLAKIAYQQQKSTQALMSYLTYLMADPDGSDAFSVLKEANDAFSQKNENQPDAILVLSEDENDFQSIDLIINNKLALNADYPVPTEMDYALAKQAHVLIELIKDYEPKKGFWSERYVPLFKWIAANDLYNSFVYTVSYPVQNDDYQKIVKGKIEEIKSFLGQYKSKWKEINSPTIIERGGKKIKTNYYFEDDYLYGIGLYEEETPKGNWEFYEDNGKLISLGVFDETGERNGNWKWFYSDGTLKQEATYQKGNLEGPYTSYHPNGQLKEKGTYINDSLEGENRYFNDYGALIEKKFYKKGELHGPYTGYYESGELKKFEYNYVDGFIEGVVKEYYENGQLKFTAPYQKGYKNGLEQNFYPNGKLQSDYTYVQGVLTGPYHSYFANGQLYEKGTYQDDELNGTYEQFYANGILSFQYTYKASQLDGPYKEFDSQGRIYTDMMYKDGKVDSFKVLDENGLVMVERKANKNGLQYEEYNRLRNLYLSGHQNADGQKNGLFTSHFTNGALQAEQNFSNGLKNGRQRYYYANGNLLSEEFFENDTIVGFDYNYFKSGSLDYKSYYDKGTLHANTFNYYKNGQLLKTTYYHRGELHGDARNYSVDGKLTRVDKYVYGELESILTFRPDGTVMDTFRFDKLKEHQQRIQKYPNGQRKMEFNFHHGQANGIGREYFINGQLEAETPYLNDKLYGNYKQFYENGQLRLEGQFLNGEWDGTVIYYHESGQKEDEMRYFNGEIYGLRNSYYPDGTKELISTYENGMFHGKRFNFSPDGELQIVRYYDYDVLIGYTYLDQNGDTLPIIALPKETGKITAYFANGKKSFEAEVKNGEYINNYKLYYASGQLYRHSQNKGGDNDGLYALYYPDGKPQYEAYYEKDDLQGIVKKYYSNGKIKQIAHYVQGKLHGDQEDYDETGKLIYKTTYYNNEAVQFKKY